MPILYIKMKCVYISRKGCERELIKQNQSKLNALHIAIDITISCGSCTVSYFLYRHFFQQDLLYEYHYDIKIIVIALAIVALCQVIFNYFCDLYRSYRSTKFIVEATNVLQSCIYLCIAQIAVAILTSQLFKFQIVIVLYYFSNTLIAIIYRAVLRKLLKYMRSKGYNKKYIAIIGVNNCTENFVNKIQTSPDLGFELSGYFDPAPHSQLKIPYLGNFKKISPFFKTAPPDEAVIMLSDKLQPSLDHLMAICENWGIKFSILPNMFAGFSSRIYISGFDGIPLLSIRKVPLENTLNKFIKRALDIILSLLMIILLSPLMLMTAVIIKLTSPGKVIFQQERVGMSNRPFTMYKFRSMKTETEHDISMAEKNDARCTRFGAFIRKFSIDELPQLFNVLKGDMSLVGPRPEIPYYVERYRKSIPLYMVKHYVKPGITGWAQVNDLRGGDTSIEERIKYDLYYIENWSILFDIKILLKTLTKGIFSKNAR